MPSHMLTRYILHQEEEEEEEDRLLCELLCSHTHEEEEC